MLPSVSEGSSKTDTQSFSYGVLDRMTSGSVGTESYNDPSHLYAVTKLSSVLQIAGATMTYDNEGRLASWTAPGGATGGEQYLYDNEGNRVLQRSSTTSGGSPVVTDTITFDEYTDTVITNGNTSTTKYYTAGGQRVAEATGTAWYYLISDLLGSTVLALKGDGTFQATHLFAPYGQVRYSDGTIPTPHNFTGQRLDVGTGLLYYGARYYDPLAGTFTSTDSLQGNDQGLNPYGYAYGNPETYSDPSGHVPFPEFDPEAWQEFWQNLLSQAPGLALGFLLSFPPPGGGSLPPINGSGLQAPPASSYSSDTAPSDSKTIDPGTQYDPGKVPEKGIGKGRKRVKGKGKNPDQGDGQEINRARGKGNPGGYRSGSPGSGWREHAYQSAQPQTPYYTQPPVIIDITPVPIPIQSPVTVDLNVVPVYTSPAPVPDSSWWSPPDSSWWDGVTSWWSSMTSAWSNAWQSPVETEWPWESSPTDMPEEMPDIGLA